MQINEEHIARALSLSVSLSPAHIVALIREFLLLLLFFCELIETCLCTNSRCLCPLVKYTFHWMGKGEKQRTSTFVICSKICQHDFCVTLALHFASVSTHFAVLCVLFCSSQSSGFCRCFFSGFEYSSRRTRWSRNRRDAALVGGPPALS